MTTPGKVLVFLNCEKKSKCKDLLTVWQELKFSCFHVPHSMSLFFPPFFFFSKALVHIGIFFFSSIPIFSPQPGSKSATNTSKGCLHNQLPDFTDFNGS